MSIADTGTILVAQREVKEAVRSKAFRITLALSAVAVVAVVIVANFAAGSGQSSTELAVVGAPTQYERGVFETIGDAVGTRIDISSYDSDAAARSAVDDGDVDAAVLADQAAIVTDEPVDLGGGSDLAAVINVLRSNLALEQGLTDAGLSPAQIDDVRSTQPPPVEHLNPAPDTDNGGRLAAAVIMNVLLFLLLQMYGSWVIGGVTREKSSRVVEVLLSAVRPRQLLFGKILGIGVVALTHMLVLVISALVAARIVGLDVTNGFRIGDIAVGGVWFLLGYLLYCCALAAAGSLCSRQEDAQGAAIPITLPLLVAYIIGFSAAGGATPLLWVLAFFPPTAVLCMPVLAATGVVPIWAVLLSMALTLTMAYGIALLAARIYRRSILRTGRRVSWRDALRGSAAT